MATKNSNSYICVELPERIKNTLYNYAIETSNKYPTFKNMEKDDLHMTFIFLGSDKKYKDIIKIQKDLDFFNENVELDFESSNVELFPPQKQNLLIVRFKTTSEVYNLRNKLLNQFNIKQDEFIPHITLGKFVGKKEFWKLDNIEKLEFKSNLLVLKNPYF